VHFHPKVTHLPGKLRHFAVGKQIDFGMSTDIQQLRRQNSYRTVIGGEGLVQLGHLATDAGVLLHEVNLDAHIAQIKGRLHPGYPAANDENFL